MVLLPLLFASPSHPRARFHSLLATPLQLQAQSSILPMRHLRKVILTASRHSRIPPRLHRCTSHLIPLQKKKKTVALRFITRPPPSHYSPSPPSPPHLLSLSLFLSHTKITAATSTSDTPQIRRSRRSSSSNATMAAMSSIPVKVDIQYQGPLQCHQCDGPHH